jgi:hypothetical protein
MSKCTSQEILRNWWSTFVKYVDNQ